MKHLNERAKVLVHNEEHPSHDVAFRETGIEYRRIYITEAAGDSRVEVGKSEDFQADEQGVFCFDCDDYIGRGYELVDEWS